MSEFAKPIVALLLASYATSRPMNTQRRVCVFLLLTSMFLFPVFLQPDLGSALVLTVISIVILFLSVKKLFMLLPWFFLATCLGVFVWTSVLYGYQKDRITSFLSGEGSAAYNAEQAYIAVGSGKLTGRGLGHGIQSQLRFLPEFYTDFFFASLSEELGFIGVLGILTLYLALFVSTLSLPTHASDFCRLATVGFVSALFFQMAVNMGMNMKLFPITGIPLPLLSSGGSSFLSICAGLGVLVRLSDERDFSNRS